jgi:hypothetical protein
MAAILANGAPGPLNLDMGPIEINNPLLSVTRRCNWFMLPKRELVVEQLLPDGQAQKTVYPVWCDHYSDEHGLVHRSFQEIWDIIGPGQAVFAPPPPQAMEVPMAEGVAPRPRFVRAPKHIVSVDRVAQTRLTGCFPLARNVELTYATAHRPSISHCFCCDFQDEAGRLKQVIDQAVQVPPPAPAAVAVAEAVAEAPNPYEVAHIPLQMVAFGYDSDEDAVEGSVHS